MNNLPILVIFIITIVVINCFYRIQYYSIKKRYIKAINLLTNLDNSQKFARYRQKLPFIDDVYELEKQLNEIVESINIGGEKKAFAKEYANLLSTILHNKDVKRKKVFKKLGKLEKKFKKKSAGGIYLTEKEWISLFNLIAVSIWIFLNMLQ